MAPWASRAPRLPDPGRQAHLAEIAAMKDDRDAVFAAHQIGEMAAWIRDLAVQHRAFREKVDQRQGLKVPSQDPDWG